MAILLRPLANCHRGSANAFAVQRTSLSSAVTALREARISPLNPVSLVQRKPITAFHNALKLKTNEVIMNTEFELGAVKEQESYLYHSLPMEELEYRGLAVHGLRIHPTYVKFFESGEVEIKLFRASSNDIGLARGFRTGKLVDVVLHEPTRGNVYKHNLAVEESWMRRFGCVSGITDKEIFIRLRNLSGFVLDILRKGDESTMNNVCIIKRSETSIYKRALSSLRKLRQHDVLRQIPEAAKCIFTPLMKGLEMPAECSQSGYLRTEQVPTIFNKHLDESKIRAIEKCSRGEPLSLIHGPPGTGKTTTLAAAILSALANGDKVLAVAPSHAACDALTLAVLKCWPVKLFGPPEDGQLVRLGNELRLTVQQVKRFLPSVSTDNDYLMTALELADVRSDLLQLHGKQRGCDLEREDALCHELRRNQSRVEDAAIQGAKLVIATNLTAQGHFLIQKLLQDGTFNLLCIDEAGFANDGHTWTLAVQSPRLIMSGDHLQLPPVVISDKAKKNGFGESLMEKLASAIPEAICKLDVQYRSNKAISDWSSSYFYGGKLYPHESVMSNVLKDLPEVKSVPETQFPVRFIDTAGCKFYEESDSTEDGDLEESLANYDEAFVVEQVLNKYLDSGVNPKDIGIIAPYWAQVTTLRSLIWTDRVRRKIEIRTVDGFQGREKELVIISFVRSNPERKVGFLQETRRINVSVTRAKRCIVAIGDSKTLSKDQGLRSFINYCIKIRALSRVENII